MAHPSAFAEWRGRVGCLERKACETRRRIGRNQFGYAVAGIREAVKNPPCGTDSVKMDSPMMMVGRLERDREAGVGIDKLRTIGLVVQIRGEEKQYRH